MPALITENALPLIALGLGLAAAAVIWWLRTRPADDPFDLDDGFGPEHRDNPETRSRRAGE